MALTGILIALAVQQVPILSISGNDLWDVCSADKSQGSACNSYVAGVLDTYATFEALLDVPTYCVPERATYGQATDVVVEYIQRNPGRRHQAGAVLILTAVREGFQCDRATFDAFPPPPVTLPIQPR